MSIQPDIDGMTFTEIVGDIEVPCEYAGDPSCPDEPARWVMHTVTCACGFGGVRIACTPCKDLRMLGEGAVVCESCGYVTVPARLAYHSIEPLERR